MQTTKRLRSVDAVRGLIMVLMALDHANYFIAQQHSTGEYWGGKFPTYLDSWQFIVRWLTHFSAPGFYLLLGVGMALYAHNHLEKGENRAQITRYFIVRGFILVAVQLFLINRVWTLSPGGWGVDWYFGTLWALGGGMILCSLLVWQDTRSLLGTAVSLFVVAEILTPNPATWGQKLPVVEYLLLVPGGQIGYWVNYPVLQWVELVIFGLVIGKWLSTACVGQPVRKRLSWIGGVMLIMFFLLRAFDGFGNIRPREGNTWIDFLNVVKYPPSMTFTLLTTGILLLALSGFTPGGSNLFGRLTKALTIFGREPLFFYALHLLIYAGLGIAYAPNGTSLRFMVFFWLYGLLQLSIYCTLYTRLKRRAKGGLRKVLQYF